MCVLDIMDGLNFKDPSHITIFEPKQMIINKALINLRGSLLFSLSDITLFYLKLRRC